MKINSTYCHSYTTMDDYKNLIRIMKTSLLLLFCFIFHLSAINTDAQEAMINLNSNTLTIEELILEIEKQTDYLVVYSNREVDTKKTVKFNEKSDIVSNYLKNAFSNTDITYDFENNYIVLLKTINNNASSIANMIKAAQQDGRTITGTIKDDLGEPIIGATIVDKNNSSHGTISDIDGKFSLSDIPANATLHFSYVGMKNLDINLDGRTSLDIIMASDIELLDELVVVGYGTQRKGDVTSSVASVKPENFGKGAIKDVGQLIQGKVAGLAIINPSGDPTSTTQFILRGTNTIGGANTAPLVLIDGIPGSINTVAPEDVESVDVLKDGSAAAIYGTRGTNGVILITTKKATGELINEVEYNGYASTSQIVRQLNLLSGDEFREMYPQEDHGANTDWIKEITRTPFTHVHNISLKGGNSSTNYIANLNFNNTEGIMLKSNNKSVTGRIEVAHRMFDDKLQLRFGILGKNNQFESTSNAGSFSGYTYRQAILRNPTDPIKNEDGSWYENLSKFEYENPLARLHESFGNVKNVDLRMNGNITYNPIEDLTLNAVISYVRNNRNHGYSETLEHASAKRDGFAGWSSVGAYTRMEKIAELTALYRNQIDVHNFSVLGGYSYNEFDFEDMYFSNYGFQDNQFGGWHNIGIGSALKEGKASANSNKRISNLIGFFGRATYAYDDRYLLMTSLRYEGASQLWGTDNEWGAFPSISLGWRISEENFMKNVDFIDDLKFRVGYGVTGSQPSSSFLGVAMLRYDKYAYVNGQWVQTIVPASNANPDLKWEEKKETNIGIDFVLFKSRLSGNIDIYNREVDGLLYEYNVPVPPNLYNRTWANGGVMLNRGVEILINAVPILRKNFEWNTNVTFSTNYNELKSLDGSIFKTEYDYFDAGWLAEPVKTISHRVEVGQRIGNFWGFKVVDVDEEGRWIYESPNGELIPNEEFSRAPEEKQLLGNGLPKYYASWNNNIFYKNFDLSVTMRGAFDYQIINEARMYFENTKNSRLENRLTSVNDLIFNKTTLSKELDPEFNSYYVEDGDYWKIDNLTLGYTFDNINRHVNSIRIYGSILNTLIITNYKGVDPEVSVNGLNPGYDNRDQYPSTRSFTLGVGIKF